MDTQGTYTIDLLNMRADAATFHYVLDDAFFRAAESHLLRGGQVEANLTVKKTGGAFRFDFHLAGTVTVTCDRCLEDMLLPVEAECGMTVRLGEEYVDDGDIVTVPHEEGRINIAWNLYEFVALEVPIQHVHEDGQCNEEMLNRLHEHLAHEGGDDAGECACETEERPDKDKPIDPRWNDLKKIIRN